MKVHPERQIEVNKNNLQQLLSLYNITDFEFEVFTLGIENTSIKILTNDKNYVLRVYSQKNKPDQDIELELEFQDFLRQESIPIPVVYRNNSNQELSGVVVDDQRWQFILMEFVDGEHPEDYSDELSIELAEIQAKMHILGLEFAKKVGKNDKEVQEMYDTIWPTRQEVIVSHDHDPKIKEFMQRARAMHVKITPDLPRGYNHLDLDFGGNIVTKDGYILAILDFDDLSFSACVVCLGNTLWHIFYKTESREKIDFYLSTYLKIRNLSSLERKILPEIILFRNYAIGILKYTLDNDIETVKRIMNLEKQIKEFKFE